MDNMWARDEISWHRFNTQTICSHFMESNFLSYCTKSMAYITKLYAICSVSWTPCDCAGIGCNGIKFKSLLQLTLKRKEENHYRYYLFKCRHSPALISFFFILFMTNMEAGTLYVTSVKQWGSDLLCCYNKNNMPSTVCFNKKQWFNQNFLEVIVAVLSERKYFFFHTEIDEHLKQIFRKIF